MMKSKFEHVQSNVQAAELRRSEQDLAEIDDSINMNGQ
jgi:aryl-alcohol dehydrogenase-like predicted oxidoreductase